MKMLARKGFRTKELPDSMCEKGIRRSPCGVVLPNADYEDCGSHERKSLS